MTQQFVETGRIANANVTSSKLASNFDSALGQ